MATSIRLAENADFSGAGLGMILPVPDLQVFNYFGGTLEKSVVNYAGGAPLTPNVSPTGTLTINPTSVDCQSVTPLACFETGIVEPEEWTMMFVGMAPNPIAVNNDRPFFIGNYTRSSESYSGAGVYFNLTGGAVLILGNDTGASKAVTLATTQTAPHFYAARLSGGTITLHDKTQDISASATDDRATPLASSTNLRIGSSGNATTMYGTSRQHWAGIASRGLSDAEITATYQQVKRAMASRGVTI